MNKLILLGGTALLALSSPMLAQSTDAAPPPDAVAASPAPAEVAPAPDVGSTPSASASAVPKSTDTAAGAAATMPAAPPTAAAADSSAPPAAAGSATANADASAKVSADWAKYDAGNKGKLTALEFGTWVLAKNGQDVTAQVERTKTSKKANLPAIKVLNATSAEFAKADKDKDRMISPDELAAYLSA